MRSKNIISQLMSSEPQNNGSRKQVSSLNIPPVNLNANQLGNPHSINQELWGWWFFDWASTPTSSASVSVFIPILLQSIAEQASIQEGTGIPCNTLSADDQSNCHVSLLGFPVTPTSYTNYITVISVVLQAILYISIGSLADYGSWRKKLLVVTTVIGSVFSMMIFLAFQPSLYWLEGLFVIIIQLAYGVSIVFYNAFLPFLMQSHPIVGTFMKNNPEVPSCSLNLVKDRVGNSISTRGIFMGYISGLFLMVVGLLILNFGDNSLAILQAPIALIGLWWLLFSLITFYYLNPRPGPDLPKGENYVLFSWKKVIGTIKQYRKLPNAFLFLIAYFMYSDAYDTLSIVAILFAQNELNLSITDCALIGVLAPLTALLGNYFFLYLQRRLQISSKNMLIILIMICGLVPLYGCISLISSTVGYYTAPELFVGSCIFGLTLGAYQSYSRVLFAELIPPGCESEFYSLYEITDKGSSFLGPLLFGIIKDYTSSMRPGFLLLVAMLLLPIPLLIKVNMTKGKQEALEF